MAVDKKRQMVHLPEHRLIQTYRKGPVARAVLEGIVLLWVASCHAVHQQKNRELADDFNYYGVEPTRFRVSSSSISKSTSPCVKGLREPVLVIPKSPPFR
jgi:hypothetical protein